MESTVWWSSYLNVKHPRNWLCGDQVKRQTPMELTALIHKHLRNWRHKLVKCNNQPSWNQPNKNWTYKKHNHIEKLKSQMQKQQYNTDSTKAKLGKTG